MAHKKAGGSTANVRDSIGRRLGVKLSDGQIAKAGAILIRQRGNKYYAGENVEQGKDDTLFATKNGIVKFITKSKKKFNSRIKNIKVVNVVEHK